MWWSVGWFQFGTLVSTSNVPKLVGNGMKQIGPVEDWIAIRTLWIFDWEKIEVLREKSRYKRATILLEVQLQHGFQH